MVHKVQRPFYSKVIAQSECFVVMLNMDTIHTNKRPFAIVIYTPYAITVSNINTLTLVNVYVDLVVFTRVAGTS